MFLKLEYDTNYKIFIIKIIVLIKGIRGIKWELDWIIIQKFIYVLFIKDNHLNYFNLENKDNFGIEKNY